MDMNYDAFQMMELKKVVAGALGKYKPRHDGSWTGGAVPTVVREATSSSSSSPHSPPTHPRKTCSVCTGEMVGRKIYSFFLST
jgi:hypothetical protein